MPVSADSGYQAWSVPRPKAHLPPITKARFRSGAEFLQMLDTRPRSGLVRVGVGGGWEGGGAGGEGGGVKKVVKQKVLRMEFAWCGNS